MKDYLFFEWKMKYTSNITCPSCEHINEVKIPEKMWTIRLECPSCKKIITGHENPHGWNWVLCTYGDTPWLLIQQQEAQTEKI